MMPSTAVSISAAFTLGIEESICARAAVEKATARRIVLECMSGRD